MTTFALLGTGTRGQGSGRGPWGRRLVFDQRLSPACGLVISRSRTPSLPPTQGGQHRHANTSQLLLRSNRALLRGLESLEQLWPHRTARRSGWVLSRAKFQIHVTRSPVGLPPGTTHQVVRV